MTVDWTRAFPASLGPSVRAVEARLPPVDLEYDGFAHETNNGRWTAPTVWGEVVMIPQRIYNPSPPTGLSPSPSLEALLLACVYSRHHNGYVRQAAARGLLECDEPFVAPFLVQLLGEYVVEIVVDIADRIEATDQLPQGWSSSSARTRTSRNSPRRGHTAIGPPTTAAGMSIRRTTPHFGRFHFSSSCRRAPWPSTEFFSSAAECDPATAGRY